MSPLIFTTTFRGVPLTIYDSESVPILHRTAIFSENILKWLGTGAILKGLGTFIQAVESPHRSQLMDTHVRGPHFFFMFGYHRNNLKVSFNVFFQPPAIL
jgi:hypothetical protein